jgi:hypothetical protein
MDSDASDAVGTNESPMRNQHRAWAEYMHG